MPTSGMLEAVTLMLTAMRNGRFTDTLVYETHHKGSKAASKGAKSGRGGRCGEESSVKCWRRRWCMNVMLLGMSWGRDGQHSMTQTLRDLRDPRQGKQHLPHPVWLKLCKLMPVPRGAPTLGDIKWNLNGSWYPTSLGKPLDLADITQITPEILGWFKHAHDLAVPRAPLDLEDITSIRRVKIIKSACGSRTFIVHVGDDIALTHNGSMSWCTIEDLLLVTAQSESYLWIFPNWYDHPRKYVHGKNLRQATPRLERTRRTQLLERVPLADARAQAPVPCEDILHQVLIVHNCIRQPVGLQTKQCKTRTYCTNHKAVVPGWHEGCTSKSILIPPIGTTARIHCSNCLIERQVSPRSPNVARS